MKWPEWLMLIRHDTSEYNALKEKKKNSDLYQQFQKAFQKDWRSSHTRELAQRVADSFALHTSDAETKLLDIEGKRAVNTGRALREEFEIPDLIHVSPYLRTKETLHFLIEGWPELADSRVVEEERVREQEHGLATLYNDYKVFHVFHPEQKMLYEKEGRYAYRYPQGENVPDVRSRNRSWLTTLTRDFPGKRVMVITHHLNILATKANLERLSAEQFIHLDEKEKPINCGITFYRSNPDKGAQGHLELEFYNKDYSNQEVLA